MYVCMYVCIYVRMYVGTNEFKYVYTYYVCMNERIYVTMCVCMYISMYICLFVCTALPAELRKTEYDFCGQYLRPWTASVV